MKGLVRSPRISSSCSHNRRDWEGTAENSDFLLQLILRWSFSSPSARFHGSVGYARMLNDACTRRAARLPSPGKMPHHLQTCRGPTLHKRKNKTCAPEIKQHAAAWFYSSAHTVPKAAVHVEAAAFQGPRPGLTPACSHATAAGPADSNRERAVLSACST